MMTFNLRNHLLKSFLSQTFCRESISLWKVLVQSKYETAYYSVSAFINLSSDSRKAFLQDLSKSLEIIGKHGVFYYAVQQEQLDKNKWIPEMRYDKNI